MIWTVVAAASAALVIFLVGMLCGVLALRRSLLREGWRLRIQVEGRRDEAH